MYLDFQKKYYVLFFLGLFYRSPNLINTLTNLKQWFVNILNRYLIHQGNCLMSQTTIIVSITLHYIMIVSVTVTNGQDKLNGL